MPAADAAAVIAAPMIPRQFVVQRVRRETGDVVTIELLPGDPGAPFAFEAGQFTMLYRFGAGEVPISISGDPTRPLPLVHTVRNVGATTKAICAVKPGHTLGVRGPFGTGWPLREAEGKDVVIVAGGVGLAPLRPAIAYLRAHRERYRRVLVLVGARTPGDLLFRREHASWARNLDLGITVDRGDATWTSHVGVVTTLLARERLDPAATFAMMCGPEIMMRFTVRELERQGVPDDRIFVSLERNMLCGIRQCGHCQLGPDFVCQDGPVFPYHRVQPLLAIREY